jgi:hypothetical protein
MLFHCLLMDTLTAPLHRLIAENHAPFGLPRTAMAFLIFDVTSTWAWRIPCCFGYVERTSAHAKLSIHYLQPTKMPSAGLNQAGYRNKVANVR